MNDWSYPAICGVFLTATLSVTGLSLIGLSLIQTGLAIWILILAEIVGSYAALWLKGDK